MAAMACAISTFCLGYLKRVPMDFGFHRLAAQHLFKLFDFFSSAWASETLTTSSPATIADFPPSFMSRFHLKEDWV